MFCRFFLKIFCEVLFFVPVYTIKGLSEGAGLS